MLFNSVEFIFLFLPASIVGFFILANSFGGRAAVAWATLASFLFYGWWDVRYLPLLLGSICFNYLVGRRILGSRLERSGLILLWIGIVGNLALLGYFKYTNFFIDVVNDLVGDGILKPSIILPLGISFFTFTQITYLVDARRGEAEEYDFINYALFVTFFPHLVAGPILHHREMMPQFKQIELQRHWRVAVAPGLALFLIGFIKKVVLADGLGTFARPVFDGAAAGANVTFFEAWSGVLAFTFQLYFDFSGYSDMAVGSAAMMGIRLPYNFDSPYQARNVIAFWRRWHMTLSRFLKEYVYIPLGGNLKGTPRRYLNLMITMLLGAFWHGAGWTFIIWGALHGTCLVLNHAWHLLVRRLDLQTLTSSRLFQMFAMLLTFLCVVVGWVWFRADSVDSALHLLRAMIGINGAVLPSQVVNLVPGLSRLVSSTGTVPLLGGGAVTGIFEVAGLLGLACVLCWVFPSSQRMSARQQLVAILLGLPFTIQAVVFGRAPTEFLYFQF